MKFMLTKLFGTSVRTKLLKYILSHPDEDFFFKDLAKNLKIQAASAKRELSNLEKFGLLLVLEDSPEKETEAKTKNSSENTKKSVLKKNKAKEEKYAVNKNFVLYEELKTLIMKSQILYEKDFVDKVFKIGDLKLLIFTGFFVNNDESSVDLFIVGKFKKDKLVKVINELETDLGREINYTFMSEREFKYRRDITDVFLYGILEGEKMVSVDVFTK